MSKRTPTKEYLAYAIIWLLLFAAPVASVYIHSQQGMHAGEAMQWGEVWAVWQHYAVYLALFLLHNFLLAPMLVYRRKKKRYFASLVLLILTFGIVQCTMSPKPGPHEDHPMAHRGDGPPPPPQGDTTFTKAHDGPPPLPPKEMDRHHGDDGPPPRKPLALIGFDNVLAIVVFLLMIGVNLGVKLYFKAEEDRRVMEELGKKSLEQQLAYLKYQINPHFLMNTLNNIHALVDIDPERAKSSILLLSRIMRYMLYDGERSTIPLQKELDFLENYIELMKMRYTEQVRVTAEMPKNTAGITIPPLLFITFVENAFKHGVSYQNSSFIDIKVTVDDDDGNDGNKRVKFTCRNSKVPKADGARNEDKQGGVGLANVRQRLNLIYGNNFTLDIEDHQDSYEVLLLIKPNKTTSTL